MKSITVSLGFREEIARMTDEQKKTSINSVPLVGQFVDTTGKPAASIAATGAIIALVAAADLFLFQQMTTRTSSSASERDVQILQCLSYRYR